MRGKPIEEYLKDEAYKVAFAESREAMEGTVTKRGGTVLEEARTRFGYGLLE